MAVLLGPEDFEGGAVPASFDTVYDSFGTATVAIDSASEMNGVYSVICSASDECAKYLAVDLGAYYSEIRVRFSVKLDTGFSWGAGGYFAIGGLNDELGGYFEIKIEDYGNGALVLQGDTLGYTDTGVRFTKGVLYQVEVRFVVSATGAVQVWVDDDVEGSPSYSNTSVNTGSGSGMRYPQFGIIYAPNALSDFWIDDITISDTTFIGPPAASIDQEGFVFGDDDGNEASHTFFGADSNITAPTGTVTLRTLLDANGDPTSGLYKLKYQKNGAGGYADVPVGDTTVGVTGDAASPIETDGNNTATSSWAVSNQAASVGDLIIVHLAWDDSTTVTSVTPPSGPNGETAVAIVGSPVASASTEIRIQAWYYIATGSWSASSLTFTPSASEQWTSFVSLIPAGQFDATTPIGTVASRSSTGIAETDLYAPAMTAGASDGNGKLFAFFGADADPITGTDTAWDTLSAVDRGDVAGLLAVRNALVTDSESISAFSEWTIASDSWASFAYIVRPPADSANEVYVDTSSNVTSGGEATTARMTAPSGKTTSDFTTGRRWDDENGDDNIDIAEDFYTELEWILSTQSPADVADYYEFRVYKGDVALDSYTLTPKWTIASGSTDVNDSRAAKVTGAAAGNSERDAKVVGADSAASEREAKTTGQDTAASSREAKVVGSLSANAERPAKVVGEQSDNDERAAKVTGALGGNATRSAKVSGVDTDSDERAAKVVGADSANDSRPAKVHGKADASSTALAKTTGADSDASERAVKVVGSFGSSSERGAKVHGQQTNFQSTRDAKTHGTDSANAERSAKVFGIDTTADYRFAKVIGFAAAVANRLAKVFGIATGTDERSAKVHGVDTATENRAAKTSGGALGADERNAKVSGTDTASSTRGARVTGTLTKSSKPPLILPNKPKGTPLLSKESNTIALPSFRSDAVVVTSSKAEPVTLESTKREAVVIQ